LTKNAVSKYQQSLELYGDSYDFILTDDSGFYIEALPDMFGVKTKRQYLDISRSGNVENLILAELEGVQNRRAAFKIVICLGDSKGKYITKQGELKGSISKLIIDESPNTQPFRSIFLDENSQNLTEIEKSGATDYRIITLKQAFEDFMQSVKTNA